MLSLVSGMHSVICAVMGKDDAKMRRKIGSADADIFRGGSEEIIPVVYGLASSVDTKCVVLRNYRIDLMSILLI